MAKRIAACTFFVIFIAIAILVGLGMNKIPAKRIQPNYTAHPAEVRESAVRILIEQVPSERSPAMQKDERAKPRVAAHITKATKTEKPPIPKATVDPKTELSMTQTEQVRVDKPLSDPKEKSDAGRLRLSTELVVSGQRILKDGNQVPLVHSSYQEIGFKEYVRKMREIGGRFFVGDAASGEIVAEAFIDEKKLTLVRLDRDFKKGANYNQLALFRPREIVNEELSEAIVKQAMTQTGSSGDLRFVVILPSHIEAGILGALKESLASTGYPVSSFEVVSGHYRMNGNSLVLRIDKGILGKTGETVSLKMDLDLL